MGDLDDVVRKRDPVYWDREETLHAVDSANGERVWTERLGPIKAEPVLQGNKLAVSSVELPARDGETGLRLWGQGGEGRWGASAISDDQVVGTKIGSNVTAFDLSEGDLGWIRNRSAGKGGGSRRWKNGSSSR